ncbi:hypothetical protein MXD61_11495 [Frankia sp. AgPm24]|uniref:hypothetical protein n=1 Tax=Frankia sp. AgPm24 TaxID=631128 RepID=UPI00200C47EF|nr:hypothetical protein [Frankia sp. AgPm24]MCK9922495.1 hypothetical protein [Frankia sp. AgPm24]
MNVSPGRTVARIGAIGTGVGLAMGSAVAAQAAPSPIDLRAAGTNTYGPNGAATGSTATTAAAGPWVCTLTPLNPVLSYDEVRGEATQYCTGDLTGQVPRVYVKQWNEAIEQWQRVGSYGYDTGGLGSTQADAYHYCSNLSVNKKFRTEAAGTGSGPYGTSTATNYSNVVNYNCL